MRERNPEKRHFNKRDRRYALGVKKMLNAEEHRDKGNQIQRADRDAIPTRRSFPHAARYRQEYRANAEVLRLIATGNANKEIGSKLSVGEDTVKRHVTNILGKLDANRRTHAVTIALKRGIIEL